jgi:hypothetical protein
MPFDTTAARISIVLKSEVLRSKKQINQKQTKLQRSNNSCYVTLWKTIEKLSHGWFLKTLIKIRVESFESITRMLLTEVYHF